MVSFTSNAVVLPNHWRILLDDFPGLVRRHLLSDPTTPCVETFACQYIAHSFPLDRTEQFVKVVCKWGGDNRIFLNVRERNARIFVAGQLEAAYDALLADDPKSAIVEVTQIRGLGISFGSKFLKFLYPERAVVLDRFIINALKYTKSPNGYVSFLNDCEEIRDELNARIIAITESKLRWRVSDVEAAIFASILNL